jgi:hypothetical protein
VVREGVVAGGRNDPTLYAHMNNKTIKFFFKSSILNIFEAIVNEIMKLFPDILSQYFHC